MLRIAAHREPFSKGERWLFAFLPFAIAGFALSGWHLSRADELPPLAFPVPAPLPSPNGFDAYVAASRAISAPRPAVDAVADRRNLLVANPKLAAKRYSLARKTAWLNSQSAAFALVQQGLATPSRCPPSAGFNLYRPLRSLATYQVIAANALVLQGRWNEATQKCLDTIQMGEDVSRGGSELMRSLGSSTISLGRDPLSSQGAPEHLTAPQARGAARRLEALLAARPTYKDAIKQQKWETLAQFLAIVQKGNWRAQLMPGGAQINWRQKLSAQMLSPREVCGMIADGYDRSIKDMDLPYGTPLTPTPTNPNPLLTSLFYGQDYRFYEGAELVPLRLLLLRFALRAYRVENGRFPAQLGELAPRYLKQIPRDYFARDAPFHFQGNGQNYRLWSVGPDGRDNGGAPIKQSGPGSPAHPPGLPPFLNPGATGDFVAGKTR